MLINNLRRTPTPPVLLSVWLNFVENGKHGCAKACPFCNFRKNPVYMCPTEEDLREFIADYMQYSRRRSILLSGGGDPLYNFEKNQDKILAILKICKELDVKIVMQSGELQTIDKYYNSLLSDIDCYYFSSETENPELRTLVKKLKDNGKFVAVSKVLNNSKNTEEIDFDTLKSWINFYKDSCSKLLIHENYNYCFTVEENNELLKTFQQIRSECWDPDQQAVPCRIVYRPHRFTIDKFVGLMNNKVMWGQEFIFPK